MYDYDSDMKIYQKLLDAAGVSFDIRNLAGATKSEIENFVNRMIEISQQKETV